MLRQVTRTGKQQTVSASTNSHVLTPHRHSVATSSTAFFSTTTNTCLPAKRPNSRGGNRRTTKSTSQPRWALRQNELREQIRALERRITVIDKYKKANEASQNLPSLDDEQLLQQLYEGVKEPDQLPDAERRREEYERLKRYRRVVQVMKARFPAAITERGSLTTQGVFGGATDFTQRMERRLDSLTRRLARLQQQTSQGTEPESSTTQQSIDQLHSEADILKEMLQTTILEEKHEEDEGQLAQLASTSEDAAGGERSPADDAATSIPSEEQDLADYTDFNTLDLTAGGSIESSQSEAPPAQRLPDESSPDSVPAPVQPKPQAQLDPAGRIQQLLDMIQSASLSRAHRLSILDHIPPQEWSAIGHACATSQDAQFLEKTFTLLEQLFEEHLISSNALASLYTAAADTFANQGNITDTKRIIERMADNNVPLDSYAQHCLIKAHLRQDSNNTNKGAMEAMTLLNNLEEAGEPASQATYSLVLTHLLDSPEMNIKDEVWGVWNRMRLNAHPTPNAVLWSKMLRACALGSTPARYGGLITSHEAHRGIRSRRPKQSVGELRGKVIHRGESQTALDLFREMTTVEGIKPNPACYDHLILACCRGRDQASYQEGFRLLSEMVSTAEELGLAAYEPTRMTYNALLEGCKIHKDVLRARWILAEMIRSSAPLWSPRPVDEDGQPRRLTWEQRAQLLSRMPDAESLGKIFLTFAAWRPSKVDIPKRKAPEQRDASDRSADTDANVEHPHAPTSVSAPSKADASPSRSLSQPDMDEAATSFSATPPSTSAGVIREVRGLLARVVLDQLQPDDQEVRGPMSAVLPSTHLLNSYLNVLRAHLPTQQVLDSLSSAVQTPSAAESESESVSESSSQSQSQSQSRSLFSKLGIKPDANTYELILDACVSCSKQVPKVDDLSNWAWTQWRQIEKDLLAGRPNEVSRTVTKSLVSRIWTARISFLAKRNRLDEAMTTLRAFVTLYPPAANPSDVSSAAGNSNKGGSGGSSKMPYYDFPAITSDLRRRQGDKETRLQQTIEKLQRNWEQAAHLRVPQQQQQKEISGSANAQLPASPSRTLLANAFSTSSTLQNIYHPRPPCMTFFGLNLLHQRLKTTAITQRPSRDKDLKFISWVTKVAASNEKQRGKGE